MLKMIYMIFVKKNERGIALLFSLTFLALLMVLALAFASNSMLEQKVAYYGKSSASSKLLSDATLSRIVTLMQFYDSGVFYSRDTTSTTTLNQSTNPYDYPTDLETKEGDSFVFEWKDAYKDKIHWDFIRQDQMQSDGSTVAKIIGRVAYVIVPDGEVSPLSIVESGLNEQGFNERRIGQKVSEMNVQALDTNCGLAGFPGTGTDIFSDTLTRKFNIVGTSTGVQPASGWTEFPTMFSDLSITDAQTKVDFRKLFLLDAQDDREAYWLDTTPDHVVEQTDASSNVFELYQRFNLKGTSQDVAASAYSDLNSLWEYMSTDKMRMYKHILLDSNGDGNRDLDPVKWEDSDDDSSYASATRIPGLLWLANFNDGDATFTASGGVSAVVNRRRQIAANLVDYCDTNDIPTSDSSNWSSTPPSFTGNEKTPYINEVYFRYSYSPSLIKSGGDRTLLIDFDVDFAGEVIDMYGCSSAAATLTLISATVQINWTLDGTAQTPVTYTYNPNVVSTVGNWTTNGYASSNLVNAFSDSLTAYGPAGQAGLPETVSIDSMKIVSANVMLTVAGTNVDYAKLSTDNAFASGSAFGSVSWINIKTSDTVSSATIYRYQTFEANDPRQNLNNQDFRTSYVDYSSFVAGKNTLAVEDISGVSTDRDQESQAANTVFPAYDYSAGNKTVSTAYIRNRPMISPWELGFIHRGKRWQTINLKNYKESYSVSTITSSTGNAANDKAAAYNIGGGAYADGDANILDEIKMTNTASSPKKVNLKTHRDNVLKSLLFKLKYGSKPEELVTGQTINGVELTNGTTIKSMTDQIKDAAIDYATRANVAEIANFKSVSSDDATQEEICGKIVNLTTASGKTQYFTVIILAQSVRDVGGNGVDVEIYKANKLGTIKDKNNCRLGTFDYTRNSVDVDGDGDNTNDTADDIAYDEILSSSKIKARLYRSLTGEVKILSYQYVN